MADQPNSEGEMERRRVEQQIQEERQQAAHHQDEGFHSGGDGATTPKEANQGEITSGLEDSELTRKRTAVFDKAVSSAKKGVLKASMALQAVTSGATAPQEPRFVIRSHLFIVLTCVVTDAQHRHHQWGSRTPVASSTTDTAPLHPPEEGVSETIVPFRQTGISPRRPLSCAPGQHK